MLPTGLPQLVYILEKEYMSQQTFSFHSEYWVLNKIETIICFVHTFLCFIFRYMNGMSFVDIGNVNGVSKQDFIA